ncbi:hypothetical protein [Streptomyces boninensis]|uniref:hypothetical protein n=1 Tax=Streptomyces boninensis TaxID=2039455 RepID=UPI003B2188E8
MLLGLVGGVCAGYVKQADSPPTPLPPLSQPDLRYPEKRLAPGAEDPVPAKDDRRVRTDGDLRKLLIDAPAGADRETAEDAFPGTDGWAAVDELAADFEKPMNGFEWLVSTGFRRTAQAAWAEGPLAARRVVLVRLYQFHDDADLGSDDFLQDERLALKEGGVGATIPGSGNGRVYSDLPAVTDSGPVPLHQAISVARRGDIVMQILIIDSRRISDAYAMRLAKKQLERL